MKMQTDTQEKGYSLLYLAILGSCACAVVQLYALPRHNVLLISLSAWALQLIWLVMGAWTMVARIGKVFPRKLVSFLLLVLFSVLVCGISVAGDMGSMMPVGIKLAGFLSLPIMLLCSAMDRTEKVKKIILGFFVVASVIFVDLYHSSLRHVFYGEYGVTYLNEVTLGYDNPNATAMYLMVCVIGLIVGAFYCRTIVVKLFFFADAIYMTWIVLQTESRAALVLLFVFAIMVCNVKRWKITSRTVRVVIICPLIVMILPILIPGIERLYFLGSALYNGREQLTFEYVDNMSVIRFFVGNMASYGLGNLHNGYLAIMASLGVPVCVCYMTFLVRNLISNLPDRNKPMYMRVAFMGFLCIVLQTSAEAAFFASGGLFAFLVYSVYTLFGQPYAQNHDGWEGDMR